MTMIWIAGANGTGSSTQITFSTIPQTFTHLQIRGFVRTTHTSDDVFAMYNFNNNTNSTGSSYHTLSGNGSTASSTGVTGQFSALAGNVPGNNSTANVFGAYIVDILDYTNTNKLKTIRSLWGFDTNGAGTTGLWSALPVTLPGTSAITSLTIICNGNITAASRVDLYGITVSSQTGA